MLYLMTKKLSGGITYQELEGCLKLLPPEELEHLDTLERKESSSTVKKLVYLTGADSSSPVRGNMTCFNLFTGNQTFAERESSFQVSETVSGHFSACAFGGGDNLDQPIGMSKASTQKVCYVSFWDDDFTLATQEAEGCLKLLPPEELEYLDTLEHNESSSPVKKLMSLTVQMQALLFVGTGRVLICLPGTRSLLRESSFQVSEKVSVHFSACAFGGEITLTNLLECLRHQLKRFATYRFGMSYTRKAGSRES
ncbi:hypothetical protein F2Q70_00029176 [Brassica cretica]|uniref:TOD1/MUCI70 glycosyltransferase-like domain-containing protein n=1 Tax=Brassica cretica TaxID=69181 RepID=A0A8S9FJ68_BRACR|nr:hypothetical protein F2Q70_00029176 [Brassica cretica]